MPDYSNKKKERKYFKDQYTKEQIHKVSKCLDCNLKIEKDYNKKKNNKNIFK